MSPTRRYRLGYTPVLALLACPWLPGCTGFQYYGTTASSFLRVVREHPDPNVRFQMYNKLALPETYDTEEQRVNAVRTLIAKLEEGTEPVASRAVICRALGELRNTLARDALIRAVGDREGIVRSQACRALGKVGRPEDAIILSRVMSTDLLEDCRIAAIEGMGELKSRDLRILQVLVTGMDHEDPAIRLASLQALQSITGKDLGVDPGPWQRHLKAEIAAAAATTKAPAAGTAPANETGTATATSTVDPTRR